MNNENPSQNELRKRWLLSTIEKIEGHRETTPQSLLQELAEHMDQPRWKADFINARWQKKQQSLEEMYGQPAAFEQNFDSLEDRVKLQATRFTYADKKQIIIVEIPDPNQSEGSRPVIIFFNRQNFTNIINCREENYSYGWMIWAPKHKRKKFYKEQKDTAKLIRTRRKSTPTSTTGSLSNGTTANGTPKSDENMPASARAKRKVQDPVNVNKSESTLFATAKRPRLGFNDISVRESALKIGEEQVGHVQQTSAGSWTLPWPSQPLSALQPHPQHLSQTQSVPCSLQSIESTNTNTHEGKNLRHYKKQPKIVSGDQMQYSDIDECKQKISLAAKRAISGQPSPVHKSDSGLAPQLKGESVKTKVVKLAAFKSVSIPMTRVSSHPTKPTPPSIAQTGTINLTETGPPKVEIVFLDEQGKSKTIVPFKQCKTAQALFEEACVAQIIDKDTRMFAVQIGYGAVSRLRKDNQQNFEDYVSKPLEKLLQGAPKSNLVSVKVWRYM